MIALARFVEARVDEHTETAPHLAAAARMVLRIHQDATYPGYGPTSRRRHCLGCYGWDGEHGGQIVDAHDCPTLHALASAWSAHPDYRRAWSHRTPHPTTERHPA